MHPLSLGVLLRKAGTLPLLLRDTRRLVLPRCKVCAPCIRVTSRCTLRLPRWAVRAKTQGPLLTAVNRDRSR